MELQRERRAAEPGPFQSASRVWWSATLNCSDCCLTCGETPKKMRRREAVRPDRRCFSYTVCCWTTCGHSRGSYRESFGAMTLANSYFFSIFLCPAPAPGGMLLDVGERKTPTTSAFTAVLAEGRPSGLPPKSKLRAGSHSSTAESHSPVEEESGIYSSSQIIITARAAVSRLWEEGGGASSAASSCGASGKPGANTVKGVGG